VTLGLIFAVVVIVPIVVLALALCRTAAIADQYLHDLTVEGEPVPKGFIIWGGTPHGTDPQLPPEEES
jgi:hypothetical protein